VKDSIAIIESGYFDGITISYSVINQGIMQPILQRAAELSVGIITMNSLGGGLIPKNKEFFSFLQLKNDETVVQAALSYSYSHPEITTLLSGMATHRELEENLSIFTTNKKNQEMEDRFVLVNSRLSKFVIGFCTGCRYCDGCPSGIDVAMMMQSYNSIFFVNDVSPPVYRRTNKNLLQNIAVCGRLKQDFNFIPENANNLCIACGRCEKRCTQSLPIIKRLEELHDRFDQCSFSKLHIKKRLEDIFSGNYAKVAFYPVGDYTSTVIGLIRDTLPDLSSHFYMFDSNIRLWDTVNNGIVIKNPSLLPEIKPDLILITSYIYEKEIFDSLKVMEKSGIKILKLHKEDDVPWTFPGIGAGQ
jgi:ferredoxin